jgi:chitinase
MADAYPPSTIVWGAATHVIAFAATTSPARNGTLSLTETSLTPAIMTSLSTAAHAHSKKALVSIGGAGDTNWDAACNATNRATFVANAINLMTTNGFDGIDLDIEQDFTHANYTACVAAFRTAINAHPNHLLTMAADPDWQQSMVTLVWQYLDQINLMSYWSTIAQLSGQVANYTSLGIPKSKLGIGIGNVGSDSELDTTGPRCAAKAQYSITNGMGGIMVWIAQEQGDHAGTPCQSALVPYVT